MSVNSANDKGSPQVPYRSAQPVNGWLIVILLIVFAVLVYRMVNGLPSPLHDSTAEPRPVTPRGELSEAEKAQIEIFRNASPSVVHITTARVGRDRFTMNLFEIPQGSGSGFIWDKKGNIVTNYHVIEGADTARVTLANNTTYDAVLVGSAPDKDLAVLKIDAPSDELQPILVGESHNLQVGQNVFAIGSPFQLDQTLTTGIVSGLGREILTRSGRPIQGVIQTNAAINPGNSGGPLLDSAGRLIGVNTAIVSPTGAFAGIGFAVPVDTVNRIVPQLIREGGIKRPGLGIEAFEDSVVRQLRDQLERRGIEMEEGVLVKYVLPGSAAEKAGILPTRVAPNGDILLGDLILAVDGKRIKSLNDLHRVLDNYAVGEVVKITIVRDLMQGGTQVDVTLQLQPLPS